MLFPSGGCKQRKDSVMKKSLLLSVVIAMTTVAAADVASAVVPPVDRVGRPALSVCPPGAPPQAIFHFDKVIFQLAPGNLVPIIPADAGQLNALPRDTDLDIKINDNPRTIAGLEGKVLSFIGAANNVNNRNLLKISDVEYAAVICP